MYHLNNASLEEIYLIKLPEKKKIESTFDEFIEKCARCFLRPICDMCAGYAWAEYGQLDRPVAYLCQLAHIKGRVLGLLSEGEKSWEVPDPEKRINTFLSKNR